MRNPRATILTALPVELAALKELLTPVEEIELGNGDVYFKAELRVETPNKNCAKAWDIFLPMPVSIGNVSAAAVTASAKAATNPDVIMFVGCAGGIAGKTSLYEIVIPDRIFYYEPAKIEKELDPRPAQQYPTHRILQRAYAEQQIGRWDALLKQYKSNDAPIVRIEPVASGELLVKNSSSGDLAHILKVSPRAIAVEQEGFGFLSAARKAGVECVVVRGISDMLDDKGSEPAEDLAQFNHRQLKATRHAGAFALAMLCHLDVSWIAGADLFAPLRSKTRIIVDSGLDGEEAVLRQLRDWLRDGTVSSFTCEPGSIKISFEVEQGHANILQAAFRTGILQFLGGRKVLEVNVEGQDRSKIGAEVERLLGGIDLNGKPDQPAILDLRAFALDNPDHRHLVENILEIAEDIISSNVQLARAANQTLEENHSSYIWEQLRRDPLVKLRSTSNNFDHSFLIENSAVARIIMNDGFRFFEKYRTSFEIRSRELQKTEICLIAPEGSHLQTIAAKSEKTLANQQSDIYRSVSLLKDIFREAKPSIFGLYGIRSFLPYCLFQYDDSILISLYFAYQREEELPMIAMKRPDLPTHAFYSFIKNTDKLFRRAEVDDGELFMRL